MGKKYPIKPARILIYEAVRKAAKDASKKLPPKKKKARTKIPDPED